jgi:adenylate kinase
MSRVNPNILISGTPGVGKSSLASVLAHKSGLAWVSVGQFAKDNDCLGDWDPEYECHDMNEDKVLDLLEDKQKPGGLIIEHHVTDLFPERWFDIVFVLRTDNTILHDRLTARGYAAKKLEENIQCEIFQTILEEAKASYREELVHELASNSQEDQEANCARIMSWIQAWHQDRGKVRSTKRKAT